VAANVAKLGLEVQLGPNFGEGGGRTGSAMVPFERAMVVSYRLSIVTIALSLTLAAICRRMSPRLKSTGVGLWGKNGDEEVDRCKPNFEAILK